MMFNAAFLLLHIPNIVIRWLNEKDKGDRSLTDLARYVLEDMWNYFVPTIILITVYLIPFFAISAA